MFSRYAPVEDLNYGGVAATKRRVVTSSVEASKTDAKDLVPQTEG